MSWPKVLATWFGDIELIRRMPWPVLKAVPDVGGEVARAIDHFFAQPGNQQVIDDLLARGIVLTDSHAPNAARLWLQRHRQLLPIQAPHRLHR